MASRPAAPPARDLSVDNMRTIAVLLVLLFHVIGLYSTLPFHLHEREIYPAALNVMVAMHVWHMPLLFLLAGVGAVAGLAKRGIYRFVRERFLRLGVPLIFGILVLVPPIVYVERVSSQIPNRWSPIDFEGSFWDFYPTFFDCCYPEGNFSYHHLWFLSFLMTFSLLLWPVLRWLAGPGGARLAERLVPRPEAAWRLLPLGFLLALGEMLLNPISQYSFRVYEDFARDAGFMLVLLFGGWAFAQPRLWAAIPRVTWIALVLAVGCTAVMFIAKDSANVTKPADWTAAPWYAHAFWGWTQWFWLLALLGLGRRYLARPIPFITAFAPLSMSFYVFHMTVLFVLAYLLLEWQPGFWVKFTSQLAISFAITYALCRLFQLSAVTRFLMGTLPARPVAAPQSTSAERT